MVFGPAAVATASPMTVAMLNTATAAGATLFGWRRVRCLLAIYLEVRLKMV
jgi:hypothetical protein